MANKKIENQANKLHKELFQLQENGSLAWANIRKTNLAFYRHLAEVYFWLLRAEQIPDFLDNQYALLNRKFKAKVKYGTNYGPLLCLVWGSNNCSDSDADRHSRALNKMDEEYRSKPQQYQKDGVVRMAQFIENSNGIAGLIDYGKSNADNNDEDDEAAFAGLTKNSVPESAKQNALFEAAKRFYAANVGAPTLDFGHALPVTDDELSVILVKKSATGFQLLGTTNDADVIKSIAVTNFKHTFSALPNSISTIVEALRTQCLPPKLFPLQHALIDKAKEKHSDKTAKLSVRRLLFRHSTSDFLLSPVRAQCGVVTIAKPKAAVMEDVGTDVFLSTRARLALERRAISNYEFNLFAAESTSNLKAYQHENSASHVLRLQSIADPTDFIHLDFWRSDDTIAIPIPQADIDRAGLVKWDWQHRLPLRWFRQLALDVLDNWFSSHALYIKREPNRICHVELRNGLLAVEFVLKDGQFELRREIPFPTPAVKMATLNAYFLTKDLMPALRSVADFNIGSEITLDANTELLKIQFSTAAADYVIYVPTANEQGVRYQRSFTSYLPQGAEPPVVPDRPVEFDYAAEAELWRMQ